MDAAWVPQKDLCCITCTSDSLMKSCSTGTYVTSLGLWTQAVHLNFPHNLAGVPPCQVKKWMSCNTMLSKLSRRRLPMELPSCMYSNCHTQTLTCAATMHVSCLSFHLSLPPSLSLSLSLSLSFSLPLSLSLSLCLSLSLSLSLSFNRSLGSLCQPWSLYIWMPPRSCQRI